MRLLEVKLSVVAAIVGGSVQGQSNEALRQASKPTFKAPIKFHPKNYPPNNAFKWALIGYWRKNGLGSPFPRSTNLDYC